jgi:hypothetical protein
VTEVSATQPDAVDGRTIDPHDTTRDDLAPSQALDTARAMLRHIERVAVCGSYAALRVKRIPNLPAGAALTFQAIAARAELDRDALMAEIDALLEAGAR